MRDLAKDSRWLQRQEPNRDNHISVNFYRAYDWLNQAIRAEAEVERLQALLEKYNAKCAVCDHVSEIMRLHKVVEAARDVVGFGACHDENSFWSIKALQNTVENYEGWKKEGER